MFELLLFFLWGGPFSIPQPITLKSLSRSGVDDYVGKKKERRSLVEKERLRTRLVNSKVLHHHCTRGKEHLLVLVPHCRESVETKTT